MVGECLFVCTKNLSDRRYLSFWATMKNPKITVGGMLGLNPDAELFVESWSLLASIMKMQIAIPCRNKK